MLVAAQGWINRILECDRLLALISINESAAAGLNQKKIAQDMEELLKGDAQALAGHYNNAIEHYRNAWRHALHLRLFVHLSSTGPRLNFVGNNNQTCLIQVSSNLVDWVVLGSCRADHEGNVEFIDSNPGQQTGRFYRVLQE